MVRNALRILFAVLAVSFLLAVTLMTERSDPRSAPRATIEPLVHGRSEVIQPLPSSPAPRAAHRATAHPRRLHRSERHASTRGLSFRALLRRAIARIPGYRDGDAQWRVTTRFGHWGVTDLNNGVIYISPRVPRSRVYDVAAHEWSHVLSVRDYGDDVQRALAAFNDWFGGHGLLGAERAADCMARRLGARWTYYTSCRGAHWREGARRLLAGREL